jgi:hypothetical protein
MKTLIIEWKHLEVDGETCERCYDTGENLINEVKRLNRKFEQKGKNIEVKETVLDENQVAQSNALLFNGVPIEDILDIKISNNYCESCSELVGKPTLCRAVFFDGQEYEDIPAKAIRQAILKVLDEELENAEGTSKTCSCGGDCLC